MPRRCAVWVATGAAVVAIFGCSGHGDAGDAGPVCREYSACTVLTASDVANALGVSVDPGAEKDVNDSTMTSAPEQVDCDFTPGGAVVDFQILCDGREILNRVYPNVFRSVDTVGDQAYWADADADAGDSPDGGSAGGQLVVWVGEHIQLNVTLEPPVGGSFAGDSMSAAVAMAQAAIPRL